MAVHSQANAPPPLGKSSIPMIGLSSGSVSAAGAISGITALPFVFPHAYCFFPANALSAAHAAGWFYCQFTTTTAGTAFLNTYTTGPLVIPGTTTAVTAGAGAFTGDTNDEVAYNFVVPGDALGPNGQILKTSNFAYTNSAGTKTATFRYGATAAAGTAFLQKAGTNELQLTVQMTLSNGGIETGTNAQYAYGLFYHTSGLNVMTPVQGSVNTTVNRFMAVTMQRNTATDNFILQQDTTLLFSDGS
jgi:hypothetical protein